MDEGRASYEEAVEAIRNWIKAVYEFSDDDVETIYANGRPIDMVREQTRNALTTYDLEYGYRGPVGNCCLAVGELRYHFARRTNLVR